MLEDHPRATLRVLTTEAPEDKIPIPQGPVCDNTMTCTCLKCQADRAHLQRSAAQPKTQPWDPRIRRAA